MSTPTPIVAPQPMKITSIPIDDKKPETNFKTETVVKNEKDKNNDEHAEQLQRLQKLLDEERKRSRTAEDKIGTLEKQAQPTGPSQAETSLRVRIF
jgi:hypothetical protein